MECGFVRRGDAMERIGIGFERVEATARISDALTAKRVQKIDVIGLGEAALKVPGLTRLGGGIEAVHKDGLNSATGLDRDTPGARIMDAPDFARPGGEVATADEIAQAFLANPGFSGCGTDPATRPHQAECGLNLRAAVGEPVDI